MNFEGGKSRFSIRTVFGNKLKYNDMKKERNYPAMFFGFVLIAFITMLILKCCKVIDWSWILVTAPIWFCVLLVFIVIVLYCVVIAKSWDRKSEE